MAKQKTAWFCQTCGAQSPRWIGKCSSCGSWNTFVEEILPSSENEPLISTTSPGKNQPVALGQINMEQEPRKSTGDKELDRVLGGGIVPGSVILLGGEPGIGKSTLLLQLALKDKHIKVLYISGEESELQIRMRAERTGILTTIVLFLPKRIPDVSFTIAVNFIQI